MNSPLLALLPVKLLFGLVGFYGISILVDYWMPNPLDKYMFTAATGAKNQRHESRSDEDEYLYCARVQHKNKLTSSNYTFSYYTLSNYTLSNVKTLFALRVTHKEKRQSRMPVNWKKRPNSRQPVFRLEVPLAPSTRKRPKNYLKKIIPVETQTPTLTYILNIYDL